MSNLIKLAALTKNTSQESVTLSQADSGQAVLPSSQSENLDSNIAVNIESAQHSIHSNESFIKPVEKLITIQEEMTEMSPAYQISPRSREISLLT